MASIDIPIDPPPVAAAEPKGYVTLIKGRIETDDGQVREFQITDEGYSQWGNTTERLGDTVDLLLEITTLMRENDYLPSIPEYTQEPAS